MSPKAVAKLGEAETIRQRLDSRRELVQRLRPAREDSQELLSRKATAAADEAEAALAAAHSVLDAAQEVMRDLDEERARQAAAPTQLATFCKLVEDENGELRARVRLGESTYHVSFDEFIDTDPLRPGVLVEISAESKHIVRVSDEPHGGDVMTVAAVRNDGEAWLEVETVDERRLLVQAADSLDLAGVTPGAHVRVHDRFAYEHVEVRATSTFVEMCRIVPDGSTTFEAVLGQDEAKRRLAMTIDRLCFPELYAGARSGATGNDLLLLQGPPGNGKTLLALAAANEAQRALGPDRVRVRLVRAGAVKDMFVGQSEKHLRELFDQAVTDDRAGVRTVLIFDEFESLAAPRGFSWGDSGVSDGLVSTLLTYLDGVMRLPSTLVLCLTNSSLLDEALVRPERLGGDRRIRLGRLDADAVLAIVRDALQQLDPETLASDVDTLVTAAGVPLELEFGTAVVGKQELSVLGRHLSSGAAARGAVSAALALLHEHVFAMRRHGAATPFDRLGPAHIAHGMARTLAGVLHGLTGDKNIVAARTILADGSPSALVHEREAKSLAAVHERPYVIDPAYDLAGMRALEVEQ